MRKYYYIIVFSFVTLYTFSQTPTEQDCEGALPICWPPWTSFSYQTRYDPNAYIGEGNFPNEINPGGSTCLDSGEYNSVWYKFNALNDGALTFTIMPVLSSANIDWALFNLTNAKCSDIYNNPSLLVSCNASNETGSGYGAGWTGPTSWSSANWQDSSGTRYNDSISMKKGEKYVLYISNKNAADSGFIIDFWPWLAHSWVYTYDTIIPPVLSVDTPSCGATSLKLKFSDKVICSRVDSSDFILTGPGGTYTLSNVVSAGCSYDRGTNFTIDVSPPLITDGTYTFKMIDTAWVVDLCYDPVFDSVSFVLAGGGGNATITPDTFCISDPAATLIAASPGGTWSGTGITNTSTGIFNPATAGVGSHQIVYILSGACSDTDTAYIVVTSKLDATINSTGSPYCSTASAFNLTANTGGGIWSGKGITNTSLGTFSPSVAGGGTHIITYTISGSCGDTKTRSIVVDTVIKATVFDTVLCPKDTPVNIRALNPNKGTWSGGGGGLTSTTSGTFDPSKVFIGAYTVTYTVTNGACTDAGTATVTVTNSANSTITPVGPFCEYDDTLTLKAVTSGGTWTGKGIINGSKGLFSPDTAGWGIHTITYIIAGGCGSTSTTTISVDSVASAFFKTSAYCKLDSPDTLSLKATNKGGVWSGNGITNTTLGIFTPSSVAIGIYPVKYVTTNGKCKDSNIVNVTVDSILLATITPVNPVCIGSPLVTLQAKTNGGYWTGNGIKDSTQSSFDPNLAGVGTHNITYTIVSKCGNTDSINIIVNDTPSVQLTIINESCPGECDGSISDSISGGTPPYTYSWSNGETTNAITNLCADIYSVTVKDNAKCEGKAGGVVSNNPAPVADFNISPPIATIPNTIITFTDNSTGAAQWKWTFYDLDATTELDTSTDASVTMFEYPQVIGYYPVLMEIWGANNCKAEITKTVFINGEYVIYVPNAFTPNGDDVNDYFYPLGVGINPDNYKLYIFSRWGELIWESSNLHTYWDGTANGGKEIVPDGVYIWKIITEEETLDKTKHKYVGHVTVIK